MVICEAIWVILFMGTLFTLNFKWLVRLYHFSFEAQKLDIIMDSFRWLYVWESALMVQICMVI